MDGWPVSKCHIIKSVTPRCLAARSGTVRKWRFASEWISTLIPSQLCSSACFVIAAGKLMSATRDGWKTQGELNDRDNFYRLLEQMHEQERSLYGFRNSKMLSWNFRCLCLLADCSLWRSAEFSKQVLFFHGDLWCDARWGVMWILPPATMLAEFGLCTDDKLSIGKWSIIINDEYSVKWYCSFYLIHLFLFSSSVFLLL